MVAQPKTEQALGRPTSLRGKRKPGHQNLQGFGDSASKVAGTSAKLIRSESFSRFASFGLVD